MIATKKNPRACIPLSLHGLDLLKREFESIKFASNLCLQLLGSGRPSPVRSSSSRARLLRQQGLIVRDALREERPLDPIDVFDPLCCQGLALATDPAPILLVRRRCSNHSVHPRLTSLIR